MLTELPYDQNAAHYFEKIKDREAAIWLDSGYPFDVSGRYDILAADPYCQISFDGFDTEIKWLSGHVEKINVDPLDMVENLMGPIKPALGNLPFSGGAIGYLSYEMGRHYMGLAKRRYKGSVLPMIVGLYDWVLVVDHEKKQTWLASHGYFDKTQENWFGLVALFSEKVNSVSDGEAALTHLKHHLSEFEYHHNFKKIQSYIYEGDCYQVNYAQLFTADTESDPWQLYLQQRQINAAPYSAFMNLGDVHILSASPEQFLSVTGSQVTTRPIKGTVPKQDDFIADEEAKQKLHSSGKDRAENLMIVDLLRNDLGKVCVPGSIEVEKLFKVESFSTIHHLVSTIKGKLATDETSVSLLKACFPGGSITGAPKFRAMEIIDELEDRPRGLYCGSVFWLGFNGNMDSNITIRTTVVKDGLAEYWAGGGIVSDSESGAEYQESLDKAQAFFRLCD